MRPGDAEGIPCPKVTIGMPVYNDVRFIREALDSLLSQTFTDFELFISDDCSTDGSADICQEYVRKDHRVQYVRQPVTLGISKNMQFLIQKSRSEYFMWAADDDKWEKEFISTLLTALASDEKNVCAFSAYRFIDENSEIIRERTTRIIDYSSLTTVGRLVKLCIYYDDGCGYGLYKKKAIENVIFPSWWWINSKTPANNIFPVLFHFLSAGNFVLASASPLWLNRLKNKPNYSSPYSENRFLGYFAFLLRKVNVCCESIKNVYRGSKSIVVVGSILPALALRCAYDCARPLVASLPVIGPALRKIKNLLRRLLP